MCIFFLRVGGQSSDELDVIGLWCCCENGAGGVDGGDVRQHGPDDFPSILYYILKSLLLRPNATDEPHWPAVCQHTFSGTVAIIYQKLRHQVFFLQALLSFPNLWGQILSRCHAQELEVGDLHHCLAICVVWGVVELTSLVFLMFRAILWLLHQTASFCTSSWRGSVWNKGYRLEGTQLRRQQLT